MQQFPQEQPVPVPGRPNDVNNRIITEFEVKPTWRLAWGLSWRMLLIGLAVEAVIAIPVIIIAAIVGSSIGYTG
jgi:hypothetical protein